MELSPTKPRSAPGRLDAAYDTAAFERLAHSIVGRLRLHFEQAKEGSGPVLQPIDPDALLGRTAAIVDGPGGDAELESLLGQVIERANHVHHPSYIGHQVSAPIPVSTLAEMVSSSLSNGMAVYEMGQLHTVMERRVIEWLAGEVGLGSGADGVLTHGGSLGNLTALLAARQARAGYDVWTEGQRGPMAVLVSDQAHYCVARAVQCMGWGKKGAALVPTDDRFRMRPEALARELQRCQDDGRQVVAVVASSCSTATGSFDPLPEIADFCAENDLWLHVDGAHGASLCLSSRHAGPVAGLERADSITWDLHKLMALPGLNTAVLFRSGRRSYESFAQEASYLFDDDGSSGGGRDEWYQVGRRTMECTKRGMSVVAYTMLRWLGADVFRENVDRLIDVCRLFADRMEAADDFEIATYPEANILCFRHMPEDEADLDQHQARLREGLVSSGAFYITQAKLHGELWLRLTVQSPFTGPREVEGLLATIRASGLPGT